MRLSITGAMFGMLPSRIPTFTFGNVSQNWNIEGRPGRYDMMFRMINQARKVKVSMSEGQYGHVGMAKSGEVTSGLIQISLSKQKFEVTV